MKGGGGPPPGQSVHSGCIPAGDYASDRHKIICASQEHEPYECTGWLRLGRGRTGQAKIASDARRSPLSVKAPSVSRLT